MKIRFSLLTTGSLFGEAYNADKPIGDEFIEFLELVGLQPEQIFYSSAPEFGIRPGADFLQFIKDEINSDILVVFLLSDAFYKSTTCICEMGAAWALSKEHIPVLIPPFQFDQVKGVIPLTQGVILNDARQLNILAAKLAVDFNLPSPVDNTSWERKRNRIVDRINQLTA